MRDTAGDPILKKGRPQPDPELRDTENVPLKEEFGRGFSEDNLEHARRFYLTYRGRISETLFREFAVDKSETAFRKSEETPPFTVSWSHYLILMRIANEDERSLYEIEAAKSGWSVRALQRQYGSSLYERLALSRDKNEVMRLAREGAKALLECREDYRDLSKRLWNAYRRWE